MCPKLAEVFWLNVSAGAPAEHVFPLESNSGKRYVVTITEYLWSNLTIYERIKIITAGATPIKSRALEGTKGKAHTVSQLLGGFRSNWTAR